MERQCKLCYQMTVSFHVCETLFVMFCLFSPWWAMATSFHVVVVMGIVVVEMRLIE